jgi:hypothetical protein
MRTTPEDAAVQADSLVFISPWATYHGCCDISIDIATTYVLGGRGLILGKGNEFFPTPQRPERLWRPPSPLSDGYWR